ncbi:MAG: redox-regulated ATPase YchF [Candidatus Absconditabacteria bacterium]|nr:redox-regulated ATPase YchF [Candidatus Absconditabacteria bacterium]MDD3868447.1 redox-regulated ATPase YchF [Candidatus Absconditabacteria bacterium]MDD4713979.1 redox-regulated ATPase YchF [Candidatus Absconditabacteria bacterium]
MKIGIVGLPNVGKSTLFNALTKSYSAPAENFPFTTIDPNIGIVEVKDERMDKLSEMSNTKKKVYATIEFVDIAGLVKGASKGEGLGNKFLANIRETDAIVQVLRYFQDPDVVHVEGTIDPLRDVEIINTELIFADLEHLERVLPQLQKKAKVGNANKDDKRLVEILELLHQTLMQGKLANAIKDQLSAEDLKLIKSYNFLTLKTFVYALNVSQDDIANADVIKAEYEEKLQAQVAIVCVKLEAEMMEMETDEKLEFLAEMLGLEVKQIPTLDGLIALAFKTLGLMYYFTTGEKETRAWTIPVGSTAPQAAGAIHTDFEKGFIKAEVVGYEPLLAAGSRAKVREKGQLRLEGKSYIVQDGDVMIFKFNV